MNSEVQRAVQELRRRYPEVAVDAEDDGLGGAFVSMHPLDPGPAYLQDETWVKFQISSQYPYADVYPLFVRPDLERVDGGSHRERVTSGQYRGEAALQISRSSPRLNAATDTAALKVTKVIEWLHNE